MTNDDASNPIFELQADTEVYQMWFVGSNRMDVMGILYKDAEG